MENFNPNAGYQNSQPMDEAESFIQATLLPGLEQLRNELTRYGREGTISRDENSAALAVTLNGQPEAEYRVRVTDRIPSPNLSMKNDNGENESMGGYFSHEVSAYTIDDLPAQEIVNWYIEQQRYQLEKR